MAFDKRINLRGSERHPPPQALETGPVPQDEQVTVTIMLKRERSKDRSAPEPGTPHLSHEEFANWYAADPNDIAMVHQFAEHYQLSVAESSPAKSLVRLAGPVSAMENAFGTKLRRYRHNGHIFRGRTGALTIPEDLSSCVLAVLGLDTRPLARPHFRIAANASPEGTFTPVQVASLYNFPRNADGTGQTIALIELGGGYQTTDLNTYFSGLGVKPPNVTAVSVDGGQNAPGSDADGEVMLDIEVAGAIAPGANIAVYFAPNTDQGFIDAITNAVHDTMRKPSVISISWGASEDSWTEQARQAMNQALQDAGALGVTVTAASGDNGSTDGETDNMLHVDFPSSSPFILACGGTTLVGSGKSISSETVWNESASNEGATGGGVSNFFALPSYQTSAGVPKHPSTNFAGRGVPDVAGNADPNTGYRVRVNGQDQVIGGTSAVAPLWAALIALINQGTGKPAGFVNPSLYQIENAFHDITQGNNETNGVQFYTAQAGWDACTGLGSPDGTAILNALSSRGQSTSAAAYGR